ncbi:hypothetical protein [Mesorhizobium sp. WSM2239]|uniref:Stability/partitioning determinant n=2 Tax=unclassified Mesorhizobium TaxID=325217 RepID=A0AAU8DJQ3_9HYPH
MSGKEILSLEEFATAPRKQRAELVRDAPRIEDNPGGEPAMRPDPARPKRGKERETTTDASKALRQMKRARMKGTSYFVNVKLDRETKRRLKLASFNLETSMQAIMEKALRQYLDDKGY